jgi:UDP-glucose 4-epimerase
MNQIMQNQPMSVFGDGTQTRAFSYIGDVAPIMAESIRVPEAYNQVFNVGADQPYTINELAEAVAHAMGVEPDISYLPPRDEVQNAYSSHEKVQHVFGRQQMIRLPEGLQRMAAWVKNHGVRMSKQFENVEVTKNFPKAWVNQVMSGNPK